MSFEIRMVIFFFGDRPCHSVYLLIFIHEFAFMKQTLQAENRELNSGVVIN